MLSRSNDVFQAAVGGGSNGEGGTGALDLRWRTMLRDPPSDRQALDFLTGGFTPDTEGSKGKPPAKKEGSEGKAAAVKPELLGGEGIDATRFDPALLQEHLRTLVAPSPSLLQKAQRSRFKWRWSEKKRGSLWSVLGSPDGKVRGGTSAIAMERMERGESGKGVGGAQSRETEEVRALRAAVLGDVVTRRVFSRLGTIKRPPGPPPSGGRPGFSLFLSSLSLSLFLFSFSLSLTFLFFFCCGRTFGCPSMYALCARISLPL